MRRGLRAVAAVTVAALACQGCTVSEPPPATPVGAGTSLVGQTVEVAATWTGAEQKNFQAVLDAFHERTGATVKYTSGGNDLAVLLNSRLAGGSPPDVAMIPQPGVVAQLARSGALTPLTGAALAAVRANYSEAWQRLGQFGGKQYGISFKVANKSLIWYRVDDFADAGVDPADHMAGSDRRVAHAGRLRPDPDGGGGRRRVGAHRLVRERLSPGGRRGQLRPVDPP